MPPPVISDAEGSHLEGGGFVQFKSGYTFRRAEAGEAAAVFGLILERIAWMDRRGFRQWNSEGYQQFYSLAYF